ncbi:MAG: DegT/DnrJ/EryC1/StrS family aminotransferase [Candidatus Hermodarchaeota archaeon]
MYKFPLFDIYWDENDVKKVTSIIKRGSYWADGPEIKEFEAKLKEYFDVKYVVVFNSGTSALHALLLAINVNSKEIIVPSMSFISTANCVVLAGANPIFADIEDKTLGLDPEDVKQKITNKTKAILPMHYGGKVCKNVKSLMEIAEDNNLYMLEDNAESFGAKIDNKLAGTFGHSSMLSFCQNKIITTGEGGAICTNDKEIYERLLLIRSHGRVEKPGTSYFTSINDMDYIEVGYNYRMPTVCAALGISQLEKIDDIISLRRKIGKYYDSNLKSIPQIEILNELDGHKTVYQLYTIKIKNPELRHQLQDYLAQNEIFTKVYFNPIHLKSYYKEKYAYKEGDLPKTEEISRKVLSLPMLLSFTKEQQDFIIDKIKNFFNL